jgi:hypothetical protein
VMLLTSGFGIFSGSSHDVIIEPLSFNASLSLRHCIPA